MEEAPTSAFSVSDEVEDGRVIDVCEDKDEAVVADNLDDVVVVEDNDALVRLDVLETSTLVTVPRVVGSSSDVTLWVKETMTVGWSRAVETPLALTRTVVARSLAVPHPH